MNLSQRFFMAMITGVGGISLKIIVNIALIPVLIATLGVKDYGLYVLIINMLDLAWVMDFGFTFGIVKVAGSYRSLEQHEKVWEILESGQWLYVLMTIAFCLLGLLLQQFLPDFFNVQGSERALYLQCLPVIFGEGAVNIYASFYRAILKSHCLDQWINIADTLTTILSNAIGLTFVLMGYGIHALLLTRLVIAVLRLFFLMYRVSRAEGRLINLSFPIRFQSLRQIFQISCHAMMTNFCIIVSHKMDTIVIGRFLPLENVGIFDVVFRIMEVAIQIGIKICDGLLPVFTRLAALNDKVRAREVFIRISSLCNFVVTLLLLIIIFFFPDVFGFLSHHTISVERSYPILAVAAPIAWTGVVTMPASAYLFFSGRQKYVTISSLIAAVSNLTLSIILVNTMLGAVGVALGTLIPQGIQHQFSLIRTARKDLGISWWTYVRAVHMTIILPLLFAYLCCFLLKPFVHYGPYHFFSLTCVAFTVVLLSGILWFVLATSAQEKRLLYSKIQDILVSKGFFKTNVVTPG